MAKMTLWETRFTLQSKHFTDLWVDYWHSTTPITQETEQAYWDKIHPGGYTVLEFSCAPYAGPDTDPRARIVTL